ncbi:MAG: flagellar hook-associated family protein [Nitratireductor sp.]
MALSNISTYALNSSLRSITIDRQQKINVASQEVATGRLADIGYSLGGNTHYSLAIENEIKMLDQTKVTNSFVTSRLESMQLSLSNLVTFSNDLVGQLAAEVTGTLDRDLLESFGRNAFESASSALNLNVRGEYVFSGVNSDTIALVDYEGTSGAPAKTAVQNAFSTHFGFAPSDPAAANLTPSDIEGFVDGPFATLFDDANWQTLWSGASDRGVRSKISLRELVETPTTAQAQSFRNIVASSVLMLEFANGNFSGDAVNQLSESGLNLAASGVSGLALEQGKIGVVEERVSNASDSMDFQSEVLNNQQIDLTGVDPYEAATRLQSLAIGLEASYAATARIQNLSIMNYI